MISKACTFLKFGFHRSKTDVCACQRPKNRQCTLSGKHPAEDLIKLPFTRPLKEVFGKSHLQVSYHRRQSRRRSGRQNFFRGNVHQLSDQKPECNFNHSERKVAKPVKLHQSDNLAFALVILKANGIPNSFS